MGIEFKLISHHVLYLTAWDEADDDMTLADIEASLVAKGFTIIDRGVDDRKGRNFMICQTTAVVDSKPGDGLDII